MKKLLLILITLVSLSAQGQTYYRVDAFDIPSNSFFSYLGFTRNLNLECPADSDVNGVPYDNHRDPWFFFTTNTEIGVGPTINNIVRYRKVSSGRDNLIDIQALAAQGNLPERQVFVRNPYNHWAQNNFSYPREVCREPRVSNIRLENVANNRHRVLFRYSTPPGATRLRITVHDAAHANRVVRFDSRNVAERIFTPSADGGEWGITIDRNRPDNSRYILRLSLNDDRSVYFDSEIPWPVPGHFSDIAAWGPSITDRGLVNRNVYRIGTETITYSPARREWRFSNSLGSHSSQAEVIEELNFIGEEFLRTGGSGG